MTETYTLNESWFELRTEIIERDDGSCVHCGAEPPIAQLEVHHIVPVRLNGSDDPNNLVTLCRRCHTSLHRLGEESPYEVEILKQAVESSERKESNREFDSRYSDDTPEQYDRDEWAEVLEDSDAPPNATLTTKHIDGLDHYYYQWREDGSLKSEYLAPVVPSE